MSDKENIDKFNSLGVFVKNTLFIAACVSLLAPSNSNACLYNTSINEFILEDTVPVCFINVPEQPTTEDQRTILNAIGEIKQSLQDLDTATKINFSGFGKCKARSGKPEIRISIDNSNPGGRAVTTPGYSREEINVHLSYLTRRGGKSDLKGQQGALYPLPPGKYQWLAKHEVLHLFGLDHDHRMANQSLEKLRSIKPTIKALPDPNNPSVPRAIDQASIMNLNDEDMNGQYSGQDTSKIPKGKLLSDLDVQCIDSIVTEARSQKAYSSEVSSPRPSQNRTRSAQ